jgi:myo-inositol 2-dehydrogenase / D-chiro-inositol 1-dehydrogenase
MNPMEDYRPDVAVLPPSAPNSSAKASSHNRTPRRQFLATATRAAAVSSLAALDISRFAHAAGNGIIRLGLIGCGGRGTGAANDALGTGRDVKLVAMADVFEERIASSLDNLKRGANGVQLQVSADTKFVGFDAYQRLLAAGVDAVILATPPGFRPLHFDAAVGAGAHCFLEKAVAVDAPGIRQLRAAAAAAKQKRLSAIVGLQDRFNESYEQLMAQIANGALGGITRMEALRQAPGLWVVQRSAAEKKSGRRLSETEFQIRNWMRFVWLSGDLFVDMLVHSIDHCVWAIGGPPQSARGRAERRENTSSDHGNTSDFLSATFTYENGVELLAENSLLANGGNVFQARIEGKNGVATTGGKIVDKTGQPLWSYSGPKKNPYQEEMNQWCGSIRQGKGLNTVDSAADSTLVAIMGRTAAYTGREVTWAEMLRSTDAFFTHNPKSFLDDPPELPDKFGDYFFPPRGRKA